MSDDAIDNYELVWHEPRQAEQIEAFDSLAAANRRIDYVRTVAREWTLLLNGEPIDWGFAER